MFTAVVAAEVRRRLALSKNEADACQFLCRVADLMAVLAGLEEGLLSIIALEAAGKGRMAASIETDVRRWAVERLKGGDA